MKAGGFDFDFGQIRKSHWDSDTKAVTVVIGKLCIKIWIKRIEPTAETDSLGRIVMERVSPRRVTILLFLRIVFYFIIVVTLPDQAAHRAVMAHFQSDCQPFVADTGVRFDH